MPRNGVKQLTPHVIGHGVDMPLNNCAYTISQPSSNDLEALHLTLITSNGLKRNAQTDMIQSQVTLDDLF